MSSPSITDLPAVPTDVGTHSLSRVVLAPLRRVAFWAAITLPFLHLPLLVMGLTSETRVAAFVVMVSLNVLALLISQLARDD